MKWAGLFFCIEFMIFSAIAQASLETELDGSGRVRYESSRNNDFNNRLADRKSFTGSRFRLGATLNTADSTSVYIQAQYSDLWGSNSGKLVNNEMTVHQAFINHNLNSQLNLKIGRQEISYGEHLLVGDVGWSNIGRSFDAVKLNFSHSLGWVDLFSSEVTVATEDSNFSGLYASFDKLVMIDEIDFYSFYSEQAVNIFNNNVLHYGTRLKSHEGLFDYRFEVTGQAQITGRQADIEVGYDLSQTNETRFAIELFTASKNFIQLYPTGHKWLGIVDVLSRRNLNGVRFGLNTNILQKIKMTLDYHVFKRQTAVAPAYNLIGEVLGGAGTSKDVGSEVDVSFSHTLNKKTSILVGGGVFMVDDYLEENGLRDNTTFIFAQINSVL